mgnify:CR=1 FL=1
MLGSSTTRAATSPIRIQMDQGTPFWPQGAWHQKEPSGASSARALGVEMVGRGTLKGRIWFSSISGEPGRARRRCLRSSIPSAVLDQASVSMPWAPSSSTGASRCRLPPCQHCSQGAIRSCMSLPSAMPMVAAPSPWNEIVITPCRQVWMKPGPMARSIWAQTGKLLTPKCFRRREGEAAGCRMPRKVGHPWGWDEVSPWQVGGYGSPMWFCRPWRTVDGSTQLALEKKSRDFGVGKARENTPLLPFPGKNGKIINIQVRAYGCSRGDSTFFSFKIPESLITEGRQAAMSIHSDRTQPFPGTLAWSCGWTLATTCPLAAPKLDQTWYNLARQWRFVWKSRAIPHALLHFF